MYSIRNLFYICRNELESLIQDAYETRTTQIGICTILCCIV